MSYSQYSSHRRPGAVPKVGKVTEFDATGEGELRQRENIEKARARIEGPAPKAKSRRAFAELIKKR